MAILLRGMTPAETYALTLALADSGDRIDLTGVVPIAVDKHSTGGVGDKTTLVVEPIVAACGVPVGKMSGRGLGFSGGTLDKMELIPGFRVNLTTQEFLEQLRTVGLVLSGQTAELAPADGMLVRAARRNRDGSVDSVDRLVGHEQEDRLRSAGDRAGCQGRRRGLHADGARGVQAGALDGRYRSSLRSAGRRPAVGHEPTPWLRRRECA